MPRYAWRHAGTVVLLLGALAGAGACQTRAPAPRRRVSDLIAQVRAKDPAATLLARELGASAAADLIPLAKDADEEVREIALLCLAESGGVRAVRTMLARLNDASPMVRGAALRGLERQAKAADVPALLHALEATDDAGARRYVALLIGSLGAPSDAATLRPLCAAHQDAETTEGCVAALAQLGDAAAREEFGRRLAAARDRTLGRYLESAERIRAAWLVPMLAPLLSDRTSIRWIGVDGLPGPKSLRAADIALNLIVEITGRHPGFPVSPGVNYTDEQLTDMRALIGR